MNNDPIVDEIHKYREELAAQFNYDVKAIIEYFQSLQKDTKRKVIKAPPKPDKANLKKGEQEKQAA